MSENKRYSYLKLKENFFDTEEMKILEAQENGYIYSNILLKMYLLSLKNEGKLTFKEGSPYDLKLLSVILNHDQDNIKGAIQLFQKLGLVEQLDTGEMFMLDIQQYKGE